MYIGVVGRYPWRNDCGEVYYVVDALASGFCFSTFLRAFFVIAVNVDRIIKMALKDIWVDV